MRCCPGLGMYTPSDGQGLERLGCCARSFRPICILASGVITTSPSTPAVDARRRPWSPAARSRACWRATSTSTSAAADPCEVPRLPRREDPLPQPPYVILDPPPIDLACQSKGGAPWSVHHDVRRGARPVPGSGASVIFLFTGPPDRVSALSGPDTQARIRRSYVKGARYSGFEQNRRPPPVRGPPAGGRATTSHTGGCKYMRVERVTTGGSSRRESRHRDGESHRSVHGVTHSRLWLSLGFIACQTGMLASRASPCGAGARRVRPSASAMFPTARVARIGDWPPEAATTRPASAPASSL